MCQVTLCSRDALKMRTRHIQSRIKSTLYMNTDEVENDLSSYYSQLLMNRFVNTP